jgi:protein-tyrosine phosphatase
MSFRILVVCTGNLCRSPTGEQLIRLAVRERGANGAIEVSSAGTHAPAGLPMEPMAALALRAHQGDDAGFTTRLLEPALLQDGDLLLGATREHRTAAVEMSPRLLLKAFTVLEFARLAPTIDRAGLPSDAVEERARTIVSRAAARRGSCRPARPDDDDMPDPMGLEWEAFVRVARSTKDAVQAALGVLVPLQRVEGCRTVP